MKIIFHKLLLIFTFFSFELQAKQYQSVGEKTKKYTTQKQKESLFEGVGCRYSNKMIIDPEVIMDPSSETQYFKDNADTILALSEKYKNNVINNSLAPMYLEFISPIVGYGIKALKPIKAEDFIGVYAGKLRNLRWNDPNFKEDVDYAWYYTIPNKQNEYMIIDGKYEGNELRFINHAKDPNTRRIDVMVGNIFYVCYVACKDIQPHEELTVSYGTGYWDSRGITPQDV